MRLLSYNIHKGIGGRDRRYRLERIAEVIEHDNPDIVLLQEVTCDYGRCGGDDQVRLLAERLNAVDRMYQQNVRYKVGCYGNAVLSRFPLEERHQISLRLKNKKPRGAQIAVIATPEGPLKIVNLHLGLSEAERHWQIAHLLAHPAYRGIEGLPEIVVGDYNDWRNTLVGGPMKQHGLHLLTAPASKYRSFPAMMPLGALDKAFCRGKLTVTEARIARHAAARVASDHLPLVVDFHLGEPLLGAARALYDGHHQSHVAR